MCVGNCETETEKQRMAVCGLPLHLGGSGRCKTLEQEFIFEIGTLNPHVINERFPFTFDRVNFWIGSCLSVRSWRHEARKRIRCARLALRLAESNYRFLNYKTKKRTNFSSSVNSFSDIHPFISDLDLWMSLFISLFECNFNCDQRIIVDENRFRK